MEYSEAKELFTKMAKDIISMEKAEDSSMRGVYLDELVTYYIREQFVDVVAMYEYIIDKQKLESDNYGDIDTSITKVQITGDIGEYRDDYIYTASGIILKDIFRDNSFVIIKVIEQHKTIERFKKIYYHVRKVYTEIEKIDYKKFVKYGDRRDSNYVISINSKYSNDFDFEVGRGMLGYYKEYKEFVDAIRQPYFELKENETE